MNFSIIAAIDNNLGIGIKNTIPWQLTADMKHFKEITTNTSSPIKINAVIMGRKTWHSLPDKFKPLPNRLNIILSRNLNLDLSKDVKNYTSLMEALQKTTVLVTKGKIENIFVIGGESIYKEAIKLPSCATLYLTHILEKFNCDTFFPEYSNDFRQISKSSLSEENSLRYFFAIYKKI